MTPTQTLIVDDSLMIIKIIKKALLTNTLDGFYFQEQSIHTASDGMKAFDIMGEGHDIKLIISDINMPNLNGDEFIEILKDTGKLKNLEVAFVTSASSKLVLPSSIKNDILGVIYKPFKYDKFNQQLKNLQEKKRMDEIENKEIKEIQISQKKHVEKVCIKYIENFKLPLNTNSLNLLIDENFGNDHVSKEEFPEIIYSVLSNFIFELEVVHTIKSKNILCVLDSFESKAKIQENRFGLLECFKSQIQYVNTNDLKLNDILNELTQPLVDKISIAFVRAKKFPKLKILFFAQHYSYIVKEFEKIDCQFMNDELQKLLLEIKELLVFNKWIKNFLEKNLLYKSVNAVTTSRALNVEATKRLSKIYQQSVLLSQHYCGKIELYIWQRAKNSIEISQYLKTKMVNTLPNSSRFLLHKKKISKEEQTKFIPFEKENVIVVSNSLNVLCVFKEIRDVPFDKWNFFCFSKLSLLEIWINSHIPDKIIIDYNFSSPMFENGIEFLKTIIKQHPIFKELVNLHKVFIIANNNQLMEIREYKNKYNFSIIQEPLMDKDINQKLLYH